jgi:putative zinc finger/helix-turn-helix YgiT family protein
MAHPEQQAEPAARCPTCGQGWLRNRIIDERFDFEDDGVKHPVVARNLPVRECDNPECGERLSGPEAARIREEAIGRALDEYLRRPDPTPEAARLRHEAVCRARGLLTPREIRRIREQIASSPEEFWRLTGIGVATVGRWERGGLLQNRSMDRYLRLLGRDEANVEFLRRLAAGADVEPAEASSIFRDEEIRKKAMSAEEPFTLHTFSNEAA